MDVCRMRTGYYQANPDKRAAHDVPAGAVGGLQRQHLRERRRMILYLAGPMTGIPQFNFPTFERLAAALRAAGFTVISPHEADPDDVQAIAWASPDGDPSCLPAHDGPVATALRNVAGLGECDGVALIDGWHKSTGTQHEIATAHRFKLPVAPVGMWLALGHDAATRALEESA